MGEEEKIIKQEALLEAIEKFTETEIRPFVQEDGGDLEILSFDIDTGVVRAQLHGACTTCPSAIMTLRFGVERRIMEQFPEVKSVQTAGIQMLNLEMFDDA